MEKISNANVQMTSFPMLQTCANSQQICLAPDRGVVCQEWQGTESLCTAHPIAAKPTAPDLHVFMNNLIEFSKICSLKEEVFSQE